RASHECEVVWCWKHPRHSDGIRAQLDVAPQSVALRSGDERLMSVRSFGVGSIPDTVMGSGRSLTSAPQSVALRSGDERLMSVMCFEGFSPCDPEMDDWCSPSRKAEWRDAVVDEVLDRVTEMDEWCWPPRQAASKRYLDAGIMDSGEGVVGGSGLCNRPRVVHPLSCSAVGPALLNSYSPVFRPSSTSVRKTMLLNGGKKLSLPVLQASDWSFPKTPLFAGAGNPQERWLNVPSALPMDRSSWKISQKATIGMSGQESQHALPVVEDLDLLKGLPNGQLEEVERDMMPSVIGSEGNACTNSNASRSYLGVEDTKESSLMQQSSEVSEGGKEADAMNVRNGLEKLAVSARVEDEVVLMDYGDGPWSVQESPYSLEIFEVSVPDMSAESGADIWFESTNRSMFLKLLRDLEEADRIIHKPAKLLRELREIEECRYWNRA
ncbi:hypothetical protein TraAM80_08901, partial [Trypanosoma rangeli]